MRKFALVLAAIAAAALSVSMIPSAQAYVHHHHLIYHSHHHQPYVARNGSQNGGNWSSDRLNGRSTQMPSVMAGTATARRTIMRIRPGDRIESASDRGKDDAANNGICSMRREYSSTERFC